MKPLLCAFCDDFAIFTYAKVGFCRWHMVLLYLGLDLDWTD